MRYEFLGPLRVLDGERTVELGGPRQQRVLAVLLAATPQEVSVDRLIDQVWGDAPPDTASHVIRTYISNLKQALNGRIQSDGRRYRLELDGDDCDAAALDDAVRWARGMVDVDPAAVMDRLDTVLSLPRGTPFEGIADDAPMLRIETAHLEDQLLSARELRMEAALAVGRQDEYLHDIEDLVRSHPLREHSCELLMMALYRSERQAEALAVYRRLRSRLVEELGLEPSRQLQELEERILLQDPALDLAPPHNLPVPTSDFVGRVDELGRVGKDLDAYRLITLVGIGGVGKTRLACEVAWSRLEEFPDGIWWFDLAPLEPGTDLVERVAEVLGLTIQPGVPPVELIRRFLARRRILAVLDNCEHLIGPAGEVAGLLLDSGPGVKVMVTSRKPLNVSGEVRYLVPPMSVPRPGEEITGLSDCEILFRTRAHQADPSFRPGTQIDDIARICVRLDGLPLAVEMAAARVRVLSAAQIAARLETDGPRLLSWNESDRDRRQKTVESTIRWSYDLLAPTEQQTFDRLSVFVGAFDIDAAEAVAGFEPVQSEAVLDMIGSLVDSSMVSTVTAGSIVRYRLLQTVREFAMRRLEESTDASEVARRHAHHHLQLMREAGGLRMTREFASIADRMDAARDDLIAALDWLLEHEPSVAIEAAAGLTEYWSRRGDPARAYRYGRRMLDAAPDASPELRADALLCASFGAALSGDFDLAATGPGEALALSADAGWQTRLWALHALGNVSTILGDLDTVEFAGKAILDLCTEEGLDLPRAYGNALLGYFHEGDLELAGRYLDAAVEGMRGLKDHGGMKIYGLVSAIAGAALRGDHEAAERYAAEAISLPGAAWSAAAYIVLGGYTFIPQGELDRAAKVLDHGTRMAYESGTEVWMRTGFLFLARLAATRGQWELAARLFGACRPNLPAWGQQQRWWDLETVVRSELGDAECDRLETAGAAAPPAEVLTWLPTIEG